MKPFRVRVVSVLVAFAALTNWGCSSLSTEPAPPVEPNPELLLGGVVGGVVGVVGGVVGGALKLINGLLFCTLLPNTVTKATVGPGGGTLRTDQYSLVIPSGALSRSVTIKMEQVSGQVNSVRFSPEGLQFAKPAKLTMGYSNCQPNPAGTPNKIVYTDEALKVLEVPPSVDDSRNKRVIGDIKHFSRYAVAW